MATIVKKTLADGRNRYKTVIRRKDKPLKARTFRTRAQAVKWGRHMDVKADDGKRIATKDEEARTVRDLVREYEVVVLPNYAQPSRRRRKAYLEWWVERIGDHRLLTVRRGLISAQLQALARGETPSKRPASPATQNRYLAALRHAFSIALRDWEWIEENPLRSFATKEPRGRVRFLSDQERRRLLDACCQSSEARLYPLVLLALSTGARQGELLSLRWRDVDLKRGMAIVHDTKNDESRALSLHGPARRVVEEVAKVRRIDSDLVFADLSGTARYPRRAFQSALLDAEIDNFRFHDLRHSAASYLAMNGATVAEIADILGHKTLAMVKRYSHLTEAHSSQVVARMNQAIFS